MAKIDKNPIGAEVILKKTIVTVTPADGKEIKPEQMGEVMSLIKAIKEGNLAPNFGMDFDLLQKSNQETAKSGQSKNKNRANIVKKAAVQTGVFAGAVVLGQEAVKAAKKLTQNGIKESFSTLRQNGQRVANEQVRPLINRSLNRITGLLPKISTPAKVIIAAGTALIAGKALYKAGRVDGVNLSEKTRQQESVAEHINKNFS